LHTNEWEIDESRTRAENNVLDEKMDFEWIHHLTRWRCRKKKQIVPRRNILRCYELATKDYVSTLRIRKERRNPITNEGDMPFARQGHRAYSCEIENRSNRFVISRARGYLKYISVGIYPKATAGPGTPVFGNYLSVLYPSLDRGNIENTPDLPFPVVRFGREYHRSNPIFSARSAQLS